MKHCILANDALLFEMFDEKGMGDGTGGIVPTIEV